MNKNSGILHEMFKEANRLGWIIQDITKYDNNSLNSHLYNVRVWRKDAPFKELQYSTHLYSTNFNGFTLGHYDMTKKQAIKDMIIRRKA